jgi:hypothetical protein
MDWVMNILEFLGLNQKRTSPHSNLVYFTRLAQFQLLEYRKVAGLSQWGILRKPVAAEIHPANAPVNSAVA